MKKCIAVLLCVCALSVSALAAEAEPDYIAEYEAQYGKMPVAADYLSTEEYQAAYDVWLAGFVPYCDRRAAEYERQKKAAEEAAAEKIPSAPSESIESAGLNYEADPSVPVSSGYADQYPDRVRADLAGNVYSLDGPLLPPDTALDAVPGEEGILLSDELADPNDLPPVTDPDTLAVIAGLVSDIATDPPTWFVEDLRPSDFPVEVLTGMKALVTSVFGEYIPVTTTSVISETVGNDTHQYLVETVAPGAAGVDYEWLAGVVLFAIMLYCLMKLLGGVLK